MRTIWMVVQQQLRRLAELLPQPDASVAATPASSACEVCQSLCLRSDGPMHCSLGHPFARISDSGA
jgi:hypothetical protein